MKKELISRNNLSPLYRNGGQIHKYQAGSHFVAGLYQQIPWGFKPKPKSKNLLTREGVRRYINRFASHSNWTKRDSNYLYNKLLSSNWDPRYVLYAMGHESNFNHTAVPYKVDKDGNYILDENGNKIVASSAKGLGQLTDDTLRSLFPDKATYEMVKNQYYTQTRSIRDQIDDAFKYYDKVYNAIDQNDKDRTYGRIKVNLLAPSKILSDETSDYIKGQSITDNQKKLGFGYNQYKYLSDLKRMYDEEFDRRWEQEYEP